MVDRLLLGQRQIGKGCPVYIIAEAGVNHNGDIELALRLVDAARQAGADAIKFQTWKTEKLVVQDARMAEYQVRNTGQEQSQFDMLKRLELSYDQFREVKTYADQQGILFLSTPDEEESADFLATLDVPAFKVGSGEVTNLPFLSYVARKGRPVILSTGMANLGEVETAVQTMEKAGNQQLVLLHCVSDYPAESWDCNLKAMDTLRKAFGYPVGFSDHTLGIFIAVAAASREACVLEKHLTLDKSLPGPDQCTSLDMDEFAVMVQAVRAVEAALGTGRKVPVKTELETRQVVQKTIVAAKDIPKGKTIADEDVVLRRSSGGLMPHFLSMVLGRKTRTSIGIHQSISFEMLE